MYKISLIDRLVLLLLLFLLAAMPVLSDDTALEIPEASRLNWHAANAVWMRGPELSWVQAMGRERAIAMEERQQVRRSAWVNIVSQEIRQTLRNALGNQIAPANFEPEVEYLFQYGEPAAWRISLRMPGGQVRILAVGIIDGQRLVDGRELDKFEEQVLVFDADGLLLLEIAHAAGEVLWAERSIYNDAQLQERTRFDNQGELEYRDVYGYRAQGGLRTISRIYADSSERSSQYSFGQGILREELHILPDNQQMLIRYDIGGRLLQEREYRQDTILQETSFIYASDEDTYPERSVSLVPEESLRIERTLKDGKELSAVHFKNDSVVLETTSLYDDQRQLVQYEEKTENSLRSSRYRYDRQGEILEETVYVDGELQERRLDVSIADEYNLDEVPAETTDILILYSRDMVVLRVYLNDRRRILEEVIEDGEVVRVRSYDR